MAILKVSVMVSLSFVEENGPVTLPEVESMPTHVEFRLAVHAMTLSLAFQISMVRGAGSRPFSDDDVLKDVGE